jgi:hypothetical protein
MRYTSRTMKKKPRIGIITQLNNQTYKEKKLKRIVMNERQRE